MNTRLFPPLSFVLPLLLGSALAGCFNSQAGGPCLPDNTCNGSLSCYRGTCYWPCSGGCEADEICLQDACVTTDPPVDPPGPADAGSPADLGSECGGERGDEGCACFGNDTCKFGFQCAQGVCVEATGRAGQPCWDGTSCNDELERFVHDGECICVPRNQGGVGENCLDRYDWLPDLPECRGAHDRCDRRLDVCLGGVGSECLDDLHCQDSLACSGGYCRSADPSGCQTRSECGSGEFCCGEATTPYANLSACGEEVEAGACFDAPADVFARRCTRDDECAAVALGSPDPEGISLCRPRGRSGTGFCTVACDPELRDPGCPSQWSCGSLFVTCFSDEECGLEGLTCVGANPGLLVPGRCQCGSGGEQVEACQDEGAGGPLEGARCVLDPESETGAMFCRLGHQCRPPSP